MVVAAIWARWSIIGFIGVSAIFLWGATLSSETAKISIKRIFWGDASAYFYTVVLPVGILIPLIITLMTWNRDVATLSGGILFTRFICVLLGDLMMRYSIMKSAAYTPLI
jgi:hypothetical protein